jgi:hypothetical protein
MHVRYVFMNASLRTYENYRCYMHPGATMLVPYFMLMLLFTYWCYSLICYFPFYDCSETEYVLRGKER